MRNFPELPDFEKPRNLRPSNCQGCGSLIGGVGGMTYMHGKWLCIDCTDRERRGLPLKCPRSVPGETENA